MYCGAMEEGSELGLRGSEKKVQEERDSPERERG